MSRACFGAAALALLAAVIPTDAGAQTSGGLPKIFSSAGEAIGIDYVPDQEGGLTPIQDTFHMQFVTGTSTMSSSNGPTARATVADPGNGATKGPANACPVAQTFPGNFPDDFQQAFSAWPELTPIFDACTTATWPFVTQADGFNRDPSTAGAVTFGSPTGQLEGQGGGAHAHIGEDGTSSTDATMSGLRIAPLPGGGATGLPLPPGLPVPTDGTPVDTSLFNVGSIQATTRNLIEGGEVVSHSESVLNGVRFIGGLVTIDSITSISETRYAAGADPVGASSTTVQGMKVLGQPATVDDQGVHGAAGAGEALQSAGLSMKLIGATQGMDDAGFIAAGSQGLQIDFTRAVDTGGQGSGTYFVRFNLAVVSSKSLARNITVPSSTGSITPPSFSTSTPTAASTSGFTGGTVAVPAAAAAVPGTLEPGRIAALLSFDLRWLYLAFTLAGFGMCIAPRLVLPARLPGLKA